jgi:AcrR family transcriptional regulator
VPRWQANARARLQDAALALYDERGFDQTTVEEIAKRAGLTKRTFFRHFTDKREVLFGGSENSEDLLVNAVLTAPASAGPLDAVGLGLAALSGRFGEQGELVARRFRIVRASPELWERQLIKFSAMAEAVARALRARGVGDPAAILAAEVGVTALRVASDQWVRGSNGKGPRKLVAEALAELRAIASKEASLESV